MGRSAQAWRRASAAAVSCLHGLALGGPVSAAAEGRGRRGGQPSRAAEWRADEGTSDRKTFRQGRQFLLRARLVDDD